MKSLGCAAFIFFSFLSSSNPNIADLLNLIDEGKATVQNSKNLKKIYLETSSHKIPAYLSLEISKTYSKLEDVAAKKIIGEIIFSDHFLSSITTPSYPHMLSDKNIIHIFENLKTYKKADTSKQYKSSALLSFFRFTKKDSIKSSVVSLFILNNYTKKEIEKTLSKNERKSLVKKISKSLGSEFSSFEMEKLNFLSDYLKNQKDNLVFFDVLTATLSSSHNLTFLNDHSLTEKELLYSNYLAYLSSTDELYKALGIYYFDELLKDQSDEPFSYRVYSFLADLLIHLFSENKMSQLQKTRPEVQMILSHAQKVLIPNSKFSTRILKMFISNRIGSYNNKLEKHQLIVDIILDSLKLSETSQIILFEDQGNESMSLYHCMMALSKR